MTFPPAPGGATGIKICGLTRPGDVAAAADCGADFLGFVVFPPSPRHLAPAHAGALAAHAPAGCRRVVLTVDATDALLDEIIRAVPVDVFQLHGHETPQRVADVRARYGKPVIKAVGVARQDDMASLDAHAGVADMVLVDAKPAPGAALPGGNGIAFDWALIAGRKWTGPWMLAGGLTAGNVAAAVRLTGAPAVDVSSGVESAPGLKDPAHIAAFVTAARSG